MGNLVVLFIHLIATMARLLGPGGVRSVVAESLIEAQEAERARIARDLHDDIGPAPHVVRYCSGTAQALSPEFRKRCTRQPR
jgi:glucose-6-phosphate-specific signal transduction histidine kinase